MWHTLSLVVALLCIAAMSLLLKAGMMGVQPLAGAEPSLLSRARMAMTNPWIIGAMLCGILNMVTYGFALKRFAVSTAYPIMISVSCVIIAIGATVF